MVTAASVERGARCEGVVSVAGVLLFLSAAMFPYSTAVSRSAVMVGSLFDVCIADIREAGFCGSTLAVGLVGVVRDGGSVSVSLLGSLRLAPRASASVAGFLPPGRTD